MLFLGLRGQGKTRMLRMLTQFLDDAIPVVAGSEINDDPLTPLSKYARDRSGVGRRRMPDPIELVAMLATTKSWRLRTSRSRTWLAKST